MGERQKQNNLTDKTTYIDYMRAWSSFEKRGYLVLALTQGIDIILAKSSSQENISCAEKGLKLVLDHTMQFLRGEESSLEAVWEGIQYLNKANQIDRKTALFVFADKLAQQCKVVNVYAEILLIPSMYQLMTEAVTEGDSVIKDRIARLNNLIYPGAADSHAVKLQLEFISHRILKVGVPDFIGAEALNQLVESIEYESLEDSFLKFSANDIARIYMDAFKVCPDSQGNLVQEESYKEMLDRQQFVKGLQELTLETLLLTQKFLDENHLKFFLGEGTMLGAVRHHGFIPWDDDVDILMPREDYERLVELAKEGKVPEELNFDALENNDKHWVLGAKMQLVRETDYIQESVIPLSKCHGPYVDIFPLDYWPKEKSLRQSWADLQVKLCRRMLFMKTGYSKATKKNVIRKILKVIIFFFTNRQIENYAMWNMKKFYLKEHKYMVNLCSYYPWHKQVFPAECYKDSMMIDFEGHRMPVPTEYDRILKKIYGKKYDSIPPYKVLDMRRHAFTLKK